MHEVVICEALLGQLATLAEEHGWTRLQRVRVRLGLLCGVVPDALEFAFEALTPGTLAEGAKLAIEHVPARFWCAKCLREFESDNMFAECRECHSLSGELRAGREMELASLEID
jgi:hydrogenase nickel incorporation protein HypA/HybF